MRGYVLIEPIKDTDKTATGVYLPEKAQDKPMKGTVVASSNIFTYEGDTVVLDGKTTLTNIYSDLEEKTIYYKKWGGDEIKDEGKEYVFVRFEDILGVVE